MKLNGFRSDLQIEKKKISPNTLCISFPNQNQEEKIKQELKKAILSFLKKEKFPSNIHLFGVKH